MANVRVAYTGLRNPGMVREITKADWKAASFPGRDSVRWDEANSWRVIFEDADEDLVDFLKEQPDFRVTDLGDTTEPSDRAEKAELRKDARVAAKKAAEADTEPVVDGPARPGGDVGATSTTTTGGTVGTAGNGSSTAGSANP